MYRLPPVRLPADVRRARLIRDIFQQVHRTSLQSRNHRRARRNGLLFLVPVLLLARPRVQVRRNYQPERFQPNSRAVRNHEIAQSQQRFVFLPHGNIQKRIGTHHKVHAVSRPVVRVPEVTHRIYGIVQLGPAEVLARFRQRWHEMRMLRARQRHHRKPVRKRRQMLLQFVGWPARRNEVNLVEVKWPVCGSRHGQVPCMNEIKRAAKQCNSSWLVFGRRAVRLRCRQSPSRSIPNPILSRILCHRWPGVVPQALLPVLAPVGSQHSSVLAWKPIDFRGSLSGLMPYPNRSFPPRPSLPFLHVLPLLRFPLRTLPSESCPTRPPSPAPILGLLRLLLLRSREIPAPFPRRMHATPRASSDPSSHPVSSPPRSLAFP